MSIPSINKPSDAPQQSSAVALLLDNPYREVLKGLFSGILEVLIDQPLVTIKNKMQGGASHRVEKLSLSKTIQALWGGAGANASGMALITGLQMGAIDQIKKALLQKQERATTPLENTIAALGGGVAAAPIASLTELLMMRHQKEKESYLKKKENKTLPPNTSPPKYRKTAKLIWQQHRWCMLSLGLPYVAGRDGLFTLSYGAAAPYVKSLLQQAGAPDGLLSTIGGGLIAGLCGAVASHPLDTWSTQVKNGLPTTSWKQSYAGLEARTMRVAMAITLFSVIDQYYQKCLSDYQKHKQQ